MQGFEKNTNNLKFIKYFRRNFKKLVRKLYKPALTIVSLQFLLFLFLTLDNQKHITSKIPLLLKYMSLSLDTYQIKDYREYISSLLGSRFSLKQLDRLDLSLSFRDKQNLDCDRQRNKDCTEDGWVRASMSTGNETYKIKLRAKGDRDFHRLSLNKMSFKVDIRGEKRFKGMEEFSIQLPAIRNYTMEALVASALENEDIVTPRHNYIRLYINGEYVGVRHVEESFSRELVEKSKRRYGPIFSLEESLGEVYENATFDLHDRKKWSALNSRLPSEALSILRKSRVDPKIFNAYFDINKWAKYMAMLDATKLFHGTVPKSVKFYLNPTNGLIEPIFFDGHLGAGIFDNYHLSDVLKKDNELPDCRWTCQNIYFYRMMFGDYQKPNNSFLITYMKNLKKFSSEKYISKFFDKSWDDLWIARGTIYREGQRRDAIKSYGLLPHVGQYNRMKKRLSNIRKNINFSESTVPSHSINSKEGILKIENKLSRFPQIYSLYCANDEIYPKSVLVKNVPIEINLSDLQLCKNNNYSFSINGGVKKNKLTNTIVSDLEFDQYLNKSQKGQFLDYSEKNIFVGQKTIGEDLLTESKTIIFEPGSKICLKEGKILHIKNSKVLFRGTKEKPNIFTSCSNNGGSIIIDNSEINLGTVFISRLNAPSLRLRELYGGINFIDTKIKGDSLSIENSLSEDAINFINSDIELNKIKFKNIVSDALDSDFSEIKLGNVHCEYIGNDCVDLSFSKANLDFINGIFIKDKVISLGENSVINVNRVKAENSAIGIVSKDNSQLYISDFFHEKVALPLAAYIKKPEFGKPYIKIKNMIPKISNLDFISDDSVVEIEDQKILGQNKSSEVSNLLYGNLYGVKTIR